MTTAVLFQHMPPLSPEEYSALEASILEHGIQSPVIVDEAGVIIDGHHRSKIAGDHGLACPKQIVVGKTDAEKRTLALSLNLDRRHLNREQRRALIAESIKADPQLSNLAHAKRTGASDKTVDSVRQELVESSEIPNFSERIDPRTGRASQPATKRHDPAPVESIDYETGEVITFDGSEDEPEPIPMPAPKVTGLDGKTYTRPEPKAAPKPQRRPITDAFWSGLYDLNKRAESLLRLIEDDRFDRNRDSIATRNLPQMRQTANTVASVLAALENSGS